MYSLCITRVCTKNTDKYFDTKNQLLILYITIFLDVSEPKISYESFASVFCENFHIFVVAQKVGVSRSALCHFSGLDD